MGVLVILLLVGCLLSHASSRIASSQYHVQRMAPLLSITELSLGRRGCNRKRTQSTSRALASSWCMMMMAGSAQRCSCHTVNCCISCRDRFRGLFVEVQNVWSQPSHKLPKRFLTKVAVQWISKQIERLEGIVVSSQLAYSLGCCQLIEAQIQQTQLQKAM